MECRCESGRTGVWGMLEVDVQSVLVRCTQRLHLKRKKQSNVDAYASSQAREALICEHRGCIRLAASKVW